MRTTRFVKCLMMIIVPVSGINAKCQNPVFISDIGAKAYYAAYDSLLFLYQVNYADHWVETNLGTCHLIETGNCEGPPVVLLPAAGCSAAEWYANLNALGKIIVYLQSTCPVMPVKAF